VGVGLVAAANLETIGQTLKNDPSKSYSFSLHWTDE